METYYREQLKVLLGQIRGLDGTAMNRAQARWDGIAKPLDGLGEFERMFVRVAGIQGNEEVRIGRKAVTVFCADNGIVEEGVTQTDSSVTAIVAGNMAEGTASVNRMAMTVGADVLPVDMGMIQALDTPGIRSCRMGDGTGNFLKGPAMTMEQALEAVHVGIGLAGEMKSAGYDLLAVGEMGIGNTTTSSALASVLLELPAESVTGRGAGLSPEGLERKIQVIKRGIAIHKPERSKPLEALAALGGFDIAGMTGFLLGAAIYRIPVVLDGMISAVAALLAQALCPAVTDYLLASHLGKEPVCSRAMERLGLKPIIHGAMALGEGTGAVMLFPLLDMAAAVYGQNRTFGDIKIAPYHKYEED